MYDGEVYVLDDVATMKVGEWYIETDKISSKLKYFVEGDDGSGVALQGDQGPCGVRGWKGKERSCWKSRSSWKTWRCRAWRSSWKDWQNWTCWKAMLVVLVMQGGIGQQGSTGPRGVRGDEGLRGFASPLGMQGPVGANGVKGERGPQGPYGTQGLVGNQSDRGERGECGERGEKGLQCDTSVVLSVFAYHLPIQLATRYGEKMWFVKYHVSEDKSSIVESSGGVQTLRNVSAYHESAWHFDAKFVDRQAHTRAPFGGEELGIPLPL